MRQKIDIADVESATKIRAKYLRALENEEFGLLPGPTFVKTFLRTYAEYLGLDAQLLVEEYRVQHEPRGEELTPIRAPRGGTGGRTRPGRDRRPRRSPPGPGAVIFGVVVVILVIVLILGLTSPQDDSGKNSGQSGKQANDTTPTTTKKKPEPAKPKKEKPTVVRLRLVPQAPTYVCIVNAAGKPLFGGTLTAPQSFKAKRMRINLGRTAVGVTVNKKRLKIPAGSNPVGYDLRPGKKPKPLPAGQRPTC